VACLGDLDGDLVDDLVVGARSAENSAPFPGAVWVLFMNADGTVKSHQKIDGTHGNFTGEIDPGDHFGSAVGDITESCVPGV